MEVSLEKLKLIFHSIIVVVALLKWNATKISMPHTILVSFCSVLHTITSHSVLSRLSHITIALCLTIFFEQVKK